MTDVPEVAPADPDRPCEHEKMRAAVEFQSGHDPAGRFIRRAVVRAWCEACEEPVRWPLEVNGNLPVGHHPNLATVEGPERQELRVGCFFADSPVELAQVTRPRLWTPGDN